MSRPKVDRDARQRGLQAAVATLAGFVVGVCGGVLTWLGGSAVPGAVIAGFGAFAATVLLILAILHFVSSSA